MDAKNKKKLKQAFDYLDTVYNICQIDIRSMALSSSECLLDLCSQKVSSVAHEVSQRPEPDLVPTQKEEDRADMVADMFDVVDAIDELRSALLVMMNVHKIIKKCVDLINKHID